MRLGGDFGLGNDGQPPRGSILVPPGVAALSASPVARKPSLVKVASQALLLPSLKEGGSAENLRDNLRRRDSAIGSALVGRRRESAIGSTLGGLVNRQSAPTVGPPKLLRRASVAKLSAAQTALGSATPSTSSTAGLHASSPSRGRLDSPPGPGLPPPGAVPLPEKLAVAASEQSAAVQRKLADLVSGGLPATETAADPAVSDAAPSSAIGAVAAKLLGPSSAVGANLPHPSRRLSAVVHNGDLARLRRLPDQGVRDLALALVEHFGSLEAGWERFDLNKSGQVSRHQWDSCVQRLPFDLEQTCGLPGDRLFAQLSQGGEISSSTWKGMFKQFESSPEGWEAISQATQAYLQRNPWAARRRRLIQDDESPAQSPRRPAVPGRRASVSQKPPGAADVLEREALLSRAELDELEQQAKAEHDILKEELEELNLKGLDALVYVLTAKLGSINNAPDWFDLSKSRKISHNEFDVGNRVLRVDLKELTGQSTAEIFRQMDSSSKGMVLAREMKEFLEKIVEESGLHDILKRAAGLAERAKKQKKKESEEKAAVEEAAAPVQELEQGEEARAAGAPRRSSSRAEEPAKKPAGGRKSPQAPRAPRARQASRLLQEEPEESPEDASLRQRVRQELSRLEQGGMAEYSADELGPMNARKTQIVEEVAEELGLFSHALPAEESRLQSMNRTSTELFKVESQAVLVFNLLSFSQKTRRQLNALEEGGRLEFPANLTTAQRQVVHILASEAGMWTKSEGKGPARRVVAYNVGDLASEVRRKLQVLKPGDGTSFPAEYTEAQRKIVHLIASEMRMFSYSEGDGAERHVEVFNLNDFAERVRRELQLLQAGDHQNYPSSLGEKERKVVHRIAQELGLECLSQGEDSERFVAVANLRDFRKRINAQLKTLPAGGSRDFPAVMSALQRKAIHEIAKELGLSSVSSGQGPHRFVTVTRAGGMVVGRQPAIEPTGDSDDEGGAAIEETGIPALFKEHASGRQGNNAIFLKQGDLDLFVREVEEGLSGRRRRYKNLKSLIYNCFEDAMQLQIDFGMRTTKGLTQQWFQVFVQRAATRIGLSLMGLLLALGHGDH